MSDIDRVCQRAGCAQPASVTLSFRYDARQASLVDLLPEKHPVMYDLCGAHADLLIVPRGWERLDRRTPPSDPLAVPAAEADTASVGEDHRFDRYAVLTAELPRLAEACGLNAPEPDAVGPRPAQLYEPVTQALLTDDVLDGQLQMPIEPESHGVVVALTRTRNA